MPSGEKSFHHLSEKGLMGSHILDTYILKSNNNGWASGLTAAALNRECRTEAAVSRKWHSIFSRRSLNGANTFRGNSSVPVKQQIESGSFLFFLWFCLYVFFTGLKNNPLNKTKLPICFSWQLMGGKKRIVSVFLSWQHAGWWPPSSLCMTY